jgi:hypothetical protein
MENTLKMPASYAVMNDEEMTYTDGGYGLVGFSIGAVTSLAVSVLSIVSYVQGVSACRKWYKNYTAANPNSTTSDQLDAAITALTEDVNKSAWNAVRDIYRGCCMASVAPLSVLLVLA